MDFCGLAAHLGQAVELGRQVLRAAAIECGAGNLLLQLLGLLQARAQRGAHLLVGVARQGLLVLGRCVELGHKRHQVRQVGGQQQRIFRHGRCSGCLGVRALAQLLVLGGVQRGADALGGVDLHLRGLALELLQAVQLRGQLRHAGACERGLGDVLLGGAGLLQPGL